MVSTLRDQARRNAAIKAWMPLSNLIMTGRQGTFRYIFTDTAMEMGLMAGPVLTGMGQAQADSYAAAGKAPLAVVIKNKDAAAFSDAEKGMIAVLAPL